MPDHSIRRRRRLCAFATLILGTIAWAGALGQEPPKTSDGPQDQVGSAESAVQTASSYIDGTTPGERKAALLGYIASLPLETKDRHQAEARNAMIPVAARILTGKETAAALEKWGKIASSVLDGTKAMIARNPKDGHAFNPFEKHALIHCYMLCRDKVAVPQSIADAMKSYVGLYHHRVWSGYGADNYRLMGDGAGFIAAEQWPDLRDADGLDAEGIKSATKQRLLGYFKDYVHRNLSEYGAPTYLGVDLMAIKLLADHARDPEVKNRASLVLDTILLQIACAWNQGYYVTPASRAKYWGSSVTSPDSMDITSSVAWLYFGGKRPVNAAGTGIGATFFFTVDPGADSYRMPELIAEIARDRSGSSLHRGSAGDSIRFTIHHTPFYSLASQWENFGSPTAGNYKEERRTMFKWLSDKPDSTFVPLQENMLRPYRPHDIVPNAFGYGENPFTQVLQSEGTLLGISSVPKDFPFWKSYAPFTRRGAIVKRLEKDGWVFCHGGSVLFAFRYARPSAWGPPKQRENCDVLWSEDRNNGWVLETAAVSKYAGGGQEAELQRFMEDVLNRTKLDVSMLDKSVPSLSYRSLGGRQLELTYRPHGTPYSDQNRIDGHAVDYRSFPLLGNDWVNQTLGGDILSAKHAGKSLVYDFNNWTRKETR